MTKLKLTNGGYTLVEALVYIAIFVLMSTVIVSLVLTILETSRRVSPLNNLSRTAVSSLEFITREIRKSSSVNVGTKRIYLDSGIIKIEDNGVYVGPLSSSDVTVTALNFVLATSTKQDLVKVQLSATAGAGKYQKSDTFYTAIKTRINN
jgi:type II secretory pathway pseudopilin PulG